MSMKNSSDTIGNRTSVPEPTALRRAPVYSYCWRSSNVPCCGLWIYFSNDVNITADMDVIADSKNLFRLFLLPLTWKMEGMKCTR